MPQSFDVLDRIQFLTGDADVAIRMAYSKARTPFNEEIIEFLNDLSKVIMKNPSSKLFSDVVTFAFWIRKTSVLKLKERFNTNSVRLGRGVAFHIAPSNVPVNFAFSLVSGLLTGNANVVRIPSKSYPQVGIIIEALNEVLNEYPNLQSYILCIRYARDKDINDYFSSFADVRVVWGGDQTIAEMRKSPLAPRSGEITFADRYSLAVIDSDSYLVIPNKKQIAEDFYNDTFLSDQNACTSPRIVVWLGKSIIEAKEKFWNEEHKIVKEKYHYQPIQGVNKLAKAYLVAAEHEVSIENHLDNLIVRVSVPEITEYLMEYRDNSGYFYEYDCQNILDLVPICNDKRCQTIGYIGEKDMFMPLIQLGIKGVDRIVPIGKTMDFDLIWDGYNLPEFLSRTIVVS